MQDTKSIGTRMLEVRKRTGMTQEQFGGLLGFGKGAVNAWERNRNPPPVAAILLLAEKGKVTTDFILRGSKSENVNPMEAQLLLFFRGMDDWMKDHILSDASNFYAQSNPGVSLANPFAKPR